MTYSSAALNSQRESLRRNQNAVRFNGHSNTLGPVSHTILLAVMLCVLGLIYLTQVTKTNAFGYRLNDLKNRKAELVSENQALQVEAAQLQSVDRVSGSSVAANLPNASDVSYVQN